MMMMDDDETLASQFACQADPALAQRHGMPPVRDSRHWQYLRRQIRHCLPFAAYRTLLSRNFTPGSELHTVLLNHRSCTIRGRGSPAHGTPLRRLPGIGRSDARGLGTPGVARA